MKSPKGLQLPSREQLLEKIAMMDARTAALVSFLYLTGARINEVLRKFKRSDMTTDGKFLIMYLLTEKKFSMIEKITLPDGKRRFKTRKKIEFRNVPINTETELEFVKFFLSYFEQFGPDDIIFNIGRTRAWQLLNKHGLFPHFLRHLRLTYLVAEKNFSDQDLVKFTGWSDSKPARFYIHLRWEDIAKKM